MMKLLKFKYLFLAFLLAILTTGSVFAYTRPSRTPSTGYDTPANTIGDNFVEVYEGNETYCQQVRNNTNQSYFIPTKSITEWTTFQTKAPSGVTFSDCCKNYTAEICAGKNCGTPSVPTSYTDRCSDTVTCGYGTNPCPGTTTCDGNWRCVATKNNGDGTYSLVTTANPFSTATNGIYAIVAESCTSPNCSTSYTCGTRSYNSKNDTCGIGEYCNTSTASCQTCKCSPGDLDSVCSTYSCAGSNTTGTLGRRLNCNGCFFENAGYTVYNNSDCSGASGGDCDDFPCVGGYYKEPYGMGSTRCVQCTSSTCGQPGCERIAGCACLVPGGGYIAHGTSTRPLYLQTSASVCAGGCSAISETRDCRNGVLSGSATNYNCNTIDCPTSWTQATSCGAGYGGVTATKYPIYHGCSGGQCTSVDWPPYERITLLNYYFGQPKCSGNSVIQYEKIYSCSNNWWYEYLRTLIIDTCEPVTPTTNYCAASNTQVWQKSGGGCTGYSPGSCNPVTASFVQNCGAAKTELSCGWGFQFFENSGGCSNATCNAPNTTYTPCTKTCTNGQCTVICTEMNRLGFISDEWLQADAAFAKEHMDEETMLGYHAWAIPLVSVMQKNPEVLERIKPLAIEWARNMAFKMGVEEKDSKIGELLLKVGIPFCKEIGKYMNENGYKDVKIDEAIIENIALKYIKLYSSEDLQKEETTEEIRKDMSLFLNEIKQNIYNNFN